MRTGKRIYHRTPAGEQALRSDGCPAPLKVLLATIGEATHFDALRARLPQCSRAQLLRSLEKLERGGLVESVAVEWLRELDRLGRYQPSALRRRTAPARNSYSA